MSRLTLLVFLLVLALCSLDLVAQVTITNQGFATTPGSAVPATPVSPPILYAPVIRLNQGPTQPVTAEAGPPVQVATQATNQPTTQTSQPFNFGLAQFSYPASQGGVGEEINGKSLAEVAREQREKPNGTNARVYTNQDIETLNQSAGVSGGNLANAKPDNWTPNNGVINPEGQPAQPNAIGAPAQSQPPMQQPNQPFAPQPNVTPKQSPPQALEKPSAQRGPQIAENEPGPMSEQNQSSSAKNEQQDADESGANELPPTASRLPLIGVLGLFTVCTGLFVRYQRAKSK